MKYRYMLGIFAVLSILIVVLTSCGNSNAVPLGSQELQVRLSEYKITSSVTTFSPGTTYHFVVTNTGHLAHEFMIMPKGTNMRGMSMDEMHRIALHMIDNVAPGETMTFDYTFPSSMMGQNLELACNLPGHYEAGMRLSIMISR